MRAGFVLTCINSVLVGILVSFNLHLLNNLRLRISKSALALSGTTISVISSTCASCSTLAFTLASTFGAIGIAASDFLSSNQILIREISTVILLFALCTCHIKIRDSCKSPYRLQVPDKSGKLS